MRRTFLLLLLPLLVSTAPILFSTRSIAMEGGDYGEFQRLMLEPLNSLADKADRILKQKYEKSLNESIPFYTMASMESYVAYRIAALKPELLAGYECYDRCKEGTPGNLLACFVKDGKPGAFIDQAAFCPVCYGEAISIFLWDEIGAGKGEIIGGLRFRYDPEVREPQQPLP